MTLAVVASQLGGCVSPAYDRDSWAVRQTTFAGHRRVQSLSDVNIGKPERKGTLATIPIAERQSGAASIVLQGDASTATHWAGLGDAFASELDAALRWLQRLATAAQPRFRIVLSLIDNRWRTRLDRSHDARKTTVIELVVPVNMPTPSSRSSEVGRALSIALHEASHAVANPGRNADRAREEYRATLVESCYLIDIMRVGDTLRFRIDDHDQRDSHFAARQSQQAARRVMTDLANAAGKPALVWHDVLALRALRRFCATTLEPGSARD